MTDQREVAAQLRLKMMQREWRQMVRRYGDDPKFWDLVNADLRSREAREALEADFEETLTRPDPSDPKNLVEKSGRLRAMKHRWRQTIEESQRR